MLPGYSLDRIEIHSSAGFTTFSFQTVCLAEPTEDCKTIYICLQSIYQELLLNF